MPEQLKGLYVFDFSKKEQGFYTMIASFKKNDAKSLKAALEYLEKGNDFIFVSENPDVECSNTAFPLSPLQNYVDASKIPADAKALPVITPEDILSGKHSFAKTLQVKEGHHMNFFNDAKWWMPVCIEPQDTSEFITENSKGVKIFKVNSAYHHNWVTQLRIGAKITPEFTWESPEKAQAAAEVEKA